MKMQNQNRDCKTQVLESCIVLGLSYTYEEFILHAAIRQLLTWIARKCGCGSPARPALLLASLPPLAVLLATLGACFFVASARPKYSS